MKRTGQEEGIQFELPSDELPEIGFGNGKPKTAPAKRILVSLSRILGLPFPQVVEVYLDREYRDIIRRERKYAAFHTRNIAKHLDELLSEEYAILAEAGYPVIDGPIMGGQPLGGPGYLDAECGPNVVENHLFIGTRFIVSHGGERLVVIQGPRESLLSDGNRQLSVPFSDYAVRVLSSK